jgi:hypothetical protein
MDVAMIISPILSHLMKRTRLSSESGNGMLAERGPGSDFAISRIHVRRHAPSTRLASTGQRKLEEQSRRLRITCVPELNGIDDHRIRDRRPQQLALNVGGVRYVKAQCAVRAERMP